LLHHDAVAAARHDAGAFHVRDELGEIVVIREHFPGDARIDLHQGRCVDRDVFTVPLDPGLDRLGGSGAHKARRDGEREEREEESGAEAGRVHGHADRMPQRHVPPQGLQTYRSLTPSL